MHYFTIDNAGLINGRYLTSIHGDNIPSNAVEVTEEVFNASIQMQRPALINGEVLELPPEAPTPEQLIEQAKVEARAYLASTDRYYARLAETGQAVPDDVVAKRKASRELLQ